MEKTFTEYNILMEELKTTHEEYKEIRKILKKSDVYKDVSDDDIVINTSAEGGSGSFGGKKIYTSHDFENISSVDKEKLIESLNLMHYECVDSQRRIHEIYVNKSSLTLDDARFFRGKPNYELVTKRFNL